MLKWRCHFALSWNWRCKQVMIVQNKDASYFFRPQLNNHFYPKCNGSSNKAPYCHLIPHLQLPLAHQRFPPNIPIGLQGKGHHSLSSSPVDNIFILLHFRCFFDGKGSHCFVPESPIFLSCAGSGRFSSFLPDISILVWFKNPQDCDSRSALETTFH